MSDAPTPPGLPEDPLRVTLGAKKSSEPGPDRTVLRAIADWRSRGVLDSASAERLAADVVSGGSAGPDVHNAASVMETSRRASLRGDALLLVLSALLNGLAFFLFAWWADLAEAWNAILAMWMVSLVPMVYVARLRVISVLMLTLLYTWLIAWAVSDLSGAELFLRWRSILSVCLAGSVALFALGGLHYWVGHLHELARTYRLTGMAMAGLALFGLTFRTFAGGGVPGSALFTPGATTHFGIVVGALTAVAILVGAVNHRFHERLVGVWNGEFWIVAGLSLAALARVVLPVPNVLFVIGFNALFLIMVSCALALGLRRRDQALFAIGGAGVGLLVLGRGFDFFGASVPVATLGTLSLAAAVGLALVLRTLWKSRTQPLGATN